jgi:putative salt-induced outer membrane protein
MPKQLLSTALPLLLLGVPAQAAPHFAEQEIPAEQLPPEPLRLALPEYEYPPPFVPAGPPRLPADVRAMIEAAIRTDDSAAVAAVVKAALETQPYDKDEIRSMQRTFLDRKARTLAAQTEAETQRIRNSGVLELWKGQVELGAFRSTGNTNNFGLTGGLKLNRKGIQWEHTVLANADYQEDSGSVTREQFGASYQPRYTLNADFFAYGRMQYEKDEIQGYRDRYSLSGGLGYRLLKARDATLSLEAGPALRRTHYVDEPSATTWSLLTLLDFDWQVSESVKLTQDASGYVGSDNNTFTSLTGIEAGMTKGLRARLSYSLEHETSPPLDAVKTDTISRFSLVYGF